MTVNCHIIYLNCYTYKKLSRCIKTYHQGVSKNVFNQILVLQLRVQRKLLRHRQKYAAARAKRPPQWGTLEQQHVTT